MVESETSADMLKSLGTRVKQQFVNNPSILNIPSSQIITVPEQGINFQIRVLAGLAKKPTGAQVDKKKDVFEPPFEEGLHLGDLTATHGLVFNKFCVCDQHVIVITKEFVPQQTLLSEADIEACLLTMKALDAFTFFNCGPLSGASQPHKHMQLIPLSQIGADTLPLIGADKLPFTTAYYEARCPNRLPQYKFQHWIEPVFPSAEALQTQDLHPNQLPRVQDVMEAYQKCLVKTGADQPDASYNVLLTTDYCMVVPRKAAGADIQHGDQTLHIEFNSLCFLGMCAVKSDQALEAVKEYGVLNLLQKLTMPLNEDESQGSKL